MNIKHQAETGSHRYGPEYSFALPFAILILFLPQLLLSLFSTLDFQDKSSLKIFYRQPSLLILPIVTFFSFSRLNIGCCSENNKVTFSKKFNYINIVVTTVSYVNWGVWYYFTFNLYAFLIYFIIPYILPLHVLSILLTAFFLHTDKLCCCYCDPREQLSVYDPDLDKRFIMVEGEIMEDPEEDVETGGNTCWRWCPQMKNQQTEHVVEFTTNTRNKNVSAVDISQWI